MTIASTTTTTTVESTKDVMTMTDLGIDEHAAADAQRARIEALRRRRAPRADAALPPVAAVSPAAAKGPTPRRNRRRHPAGRSRIGIAAFSVATMLGLVGVMGLARPASSGSPTAPADTTAALLPTPVAAPAAAAAAMASGEAIAAPPVALTARPSVRVTIPTAVAPVARTNGSH
jgi:hypothetical protein